jgi:hypothetical protein
MIRCLGIFLLVSHFLSCCFANQYYSLSNEPIDVVIPCIRKDLEILDLCIAGIRANGSSIRRIIVVSPERLTDQAEWFDEALFPFTKYDIAFHLMKKNKQATKHIWDTCPGQAGWCYQQLLKLYAPFIIPNLSSNVLILDADTIFLNQVCFLNEQGGGLFAPGFSNYYVYYEHADRCLTGVHKVFPEFSGIAHHMLFQKPILEDLFSRIEQQHQKPLWQAFCLAADERLVPNGPFASEFELYFNFVFANTDQVNIRLLKWTDIASIDNLASLKKQGYHYVSNHSYMRKKQSTMRD